MNTIRKYVETMDDSDRLRIFAEAIDWEQDGCIGDGAIRAHTVSWVKEVGIDYDARMSIHMQAMVNEVWRHFAAIEILRRIS